jgi:hypothetical protein
LATYLRNKINNMNYAIAKFPLNILASRLTHKASCI